MREFIFFQVYVRSVATWARVFDFGYGTNAWMFFTVKGGSGVALFRISNYSNNAVYDAATNQALPANQWVHVAVVMQTQTVTVYLNGTSAGSTSGVPLAPYQLYPYAAAANYIGRSQWPADPYLNGIVDDFRIYQGALSPLQINEIANPTVLNTYYTFDQNNGTLVVTDSSVNGQNGTLGGNSSFVKGISNNAVSLDGTSGYVLLPAGILANLVDFTVATWVYARSTATWARIFDFGFGTSSWMMFTVNGNSRLPGFEIVNYGGKVYTVSANKAFPTNQWVHVAVTLTGEIGTIYFNGTVVGNATGIPISPFQLFDVAAAQNYIGKSQYASDPYFNGLIDDFRFYQGALTQTQINALIALVG